MEKAKSALGGVAGALALTVLHETIKRMDKDAPRMDLLGMNALSKVMHKAGQPVPANNKLYPITMAGDIVSNSIYYAAVGAAGSKNSIWLRGILLGLTAGFGAVTLPKPLGLNEQYSARTTKTEAMTIALYLIGGLVAAAVTKSLQREDTVAKKIGKRLH